MNTGGKLGAYHVDENGRYGTFTGTWMVRLQPMMNPLGRLGQVPFTMCLVRN